MVYHHTSSQGIRISIRSGTRANLRVISHHLSARRVSLYIIIHTREGPARRIQRDRTVPKDRICERLVEIDRVPLAEAIRQDQRLRDELMESVCCVA